MKMENSKETSFWGRFFNSIKKNRNIIVIGLTCLLAGAGGAFALNQNGNNASVKGVSTKAIETLNPTNTETPAPTTCPTNQNNLEKSYTKQPSTAPITNNQSQPQSNSTPRPPDPTPIPTRTCNNTAKQLAIHQENDSYNNSLEQLTNSHNILVANYNSIINSEGCRSPDAYQSACADAERKLQEENARYQSEVNRMKTSHQDMLNRINSTCYQ